MKGVTDPQFRILLFFMLAVWFYCQFTVVGSPMSPVLFTVTAGCSENHLITRCGPVALPQTQLGKLVNLELLALFSYN